jgi:hypothetical protein
MLIILVRLFENPALCAMLAQNVLIGITFYGILYYMPIYYQSVHQWSPLVSAALLIPMVGIQSVIYSVRDGLLFHAWLAVRNILLTLRSWLAIIFLLKEGMER